MEESLLAPGLDFSANENDGLHLGEPSSNDPTIADPIMSDTLTRTRRLQPKLNSDILLSERGLPYLVKHGPKKLRISTSRNKPYDNLSRIVQFYQLWAHELYPRAKFKDFIKICHTMKNDKLVREYRTELCMKEMNFSGVRSWDHENEEIQDEDIYQESVTRKASEKEAFTVEADTQSEEQAAPDMQEPLAEKGDADLQEDEDALQVMKELGF